MNSFKHLKFLSLISVISLVLMWIITYFTQNIWLALLISAVADSIQIVSYVLGFIKREMPVKKISEDIEVIHEYVIEKEEASRVKEDLITRLVNEGVIKETELYSLIRNKEIILAFPYGKGIPEGIKKLGYRRPPQIVLLEKIGFVRATRYQNLMVAFTDTLSKSLRKIDNLNAFIKRELPKIWKEISIKSMNAFPPSQYQKYEKWRTGEGFGIMYILSKSMAQDFIIDYINRESFTPEFRKHVWRVIDRTKLRDAIKKRRHQVRKIVSKISIDFLLRDIPRNIRQLILTHEDEIKKHFGIKVFTDYRLIEQEKITNLLSSLLPEIGKDKLNQYSSTILIESQECYNVLKQLGISF
jgi:hypothetical protein